MQDSRRHLLAIRSVPGFELTEELYAEGDALQAHAHTWPHVVLLLDGSIEETACDGVARRLDHPSIIHFPERISHQIRFPERTSLLSVEVKPARQRMMQELAIDDGRSWVGASSEIVALSRRLRDSIARGTAAANFAIEGLILQLIATGAAIAAAQQPSEPRIAREARQFVTENFTSAIGLSRVAEAIGSSPSHLAQVYRDCYGETIGETIRSLRIEHARALMSDVRLSLGEIAHMAGFYDQPHFVHSFREATGLTPSGYRRQLARSSEEEEPVSRGSKPKRHF